MAELYCLLSGVRDPESGTSALASQFCPQTAAHLADAAALCKDVPGVCVCVCVCVCV